MITRISKPIGIVFALLFSFSAPLGAQQIEPLAGTWKTWVLASGSQLRLPPPPISIFGTEVSELRALTATAAGGRIELTSHDILVLKVLADRQGEVVRRIDIVEEVCGLNSEATLRTVDNHIVALRQAIGDDPRHPRWLHTVRGEGYRLTFP